MRTAWIYSFLLAACLPGCALFNPDQPPYSVVTPKPDANTLWISREGMTLGYVPEVIRAQGKNQQWTKRLYKQYLYIDDPATMHTDSAMKVMQQVCRLFPEFDQAYPLQVTVASQSSHKEQYKQPFLNEQILNGQNSPAVAKLAMGQFSILQRMPMLVEAGRFWFSYSPQANSYLLWRLNTPAYYLTAPVC